ncbi:hypothetical protein ACFL5K_02160, partial [Gemmatimonadota bacterium]
ELYFKNTGLQTLNVYGAPDESFDPNVVPATAAGFGFGFNPNQFSVNPGDSVRITLGGGSFYIASDIPLPHECEIPIVLYEQASDTVVLSDTLRFMVETGSDESPPELRLWSMGLVTVGQQDTIQVGIVDGGTISSASAEIRNQQDGTLYATLTLYDDGTTEGDTLSGDNWYSALFTPPDLGDYWIAVRVEDSYGNISETINSYRFTTKPFEPTSPLLLVGGNNGCNPWNIGSYNIYRETLDELGYSYDFYDGFMYNSQETDATGLPDSSALAQYAGGVVVYCGMPDGTDWRKFDYMQSLNISAWIGGEDIATYADRWPELAATASTYWGVQYVSNHVGSNGVKDVGGDPIADGLIFTLPGEYWDEMDPVGGGVASMNYLQGAFSGSAAISNDAGTYKSYVTGFPLSALEYHSQRVDLASRVMSWLYPEFGTRVREPDAYSDITTTDTAGAAVDKILSFIPSSNGALAADDTIFIHFDLPPGTWITDTLYFDSIGVAVVDSIFTTCVWAGLNGSDTLSIVLPVSIEPHQQVQVKIKSFINPDTQGLYDYQIRTNRDNLWVPGQMEIINYAYPLVMTRDSLVWDHGNHNKITEVGEHLEFLLEFTNMGFETIDYYAVADIESDPTAGGWCGLGGGKSRYYRARRNSLDMAAPLYSLSDSSGQRAENTGYALPAGYR